MSYGWRDVRCISSFQLHFRCVDPIHSNAILFTLNRWSQTYVKQKWCQSLLIVIIVYCSFFVSGSNVWATQCHQVELKLWFLRSVATVAISNQWAIELVNAPLEFRALFDSYGGWQMPKDRKHWNSFAAFRSSHLVCFWRFYLYRDLELWWKSCSSQRDSFRAQRRDPWCPVRLLWPTYRHLLKWSNRKGARNRTAPSPPSRTNTTTKCRISFA